MAILEAGSPSNRPVLYGRLHLAPIGHFVEIFSKCHLAPTMDRNGRSRGNRPRRPLVPGNSRLSPGNRLPAASDRPPCAYTSAQLHIPGIDGKLWPGASQWHRVFCPQPVGFLTPTFSRPYSCTVRLYRESTVAEGSPRRAASNGTGHVRIARRIRPGLASPVLPCSHDRPPGAQ